MSRSRARDRARPQRSGGASQWTPWASLGGQWFDAATGTTGSPVSAWVARNATATATQGTVANQPAAPTSNANLGDEMAMLFDGVDDNLISGTALDCSAGWSACSVLRVSTIKDISGLVRVSTGELTGGGSADGFVVYTGLSGRIIVASPDAGTWYRQTTTGLVTSSTSYAVIVTCDGTGAGIALHLGTISGGSISWALPSLSAVAGSFGLPSATGRYLQPGGGYTASNSRFPGDIALVGATGRGWSADEVTQLKGYLQSRFA